MADFEDNNGFLPATTNGANLQSNQMAIADLLKYRDKLVKDYHGGVEGGLAAKLEADQTADMDAYLFAFIKEVVKETDHLLGNELLAAENGDLRDSSVISFKRAEVLEKAIKAVQTRQQIEAQSGIDVESPSMLVIFRYFLGKAKEAFDKMNVGSEINDLFFTTFGSVTENWQKDLKKQFEAIRETSATKNPLKR